MHVRTLYVYKPHTDIQVFQSNQFIEALNHCNYHFTWAVNDWEGLMRGKDCLQKGLHKHGTL